ncbi:gamma-glutamyltransferase family protein [Blastococcus xanthinilyticus]|uniref:Gamma-glutamyltranspeptidase/glutathione hydrolase n=1 Tax=Blastococcus xanthinilyticus TaxID=1564164 RepID=A0A5S5D2S9_9ACTN|nr:gamma-glutamyltransferase [Blastococcus xanthinilyticus]TYP89578.1 gamma-glutamyltranspeptidase/glutathione hydrolase [Blastococcus xanthinilyticus]
MSWKTETVPGTDGLVCSIDRLASEAGTAVLRAGGNAVDAAIATSAALAVTAPHMCGLGGDLFALVGGPGTGSAEPLVLNSSGRAGSGADPDRMRAEGHRTMPLVADVRSAPVPGCVDGWVTLHGRLGRLPLADVLAPAVELAEAGFPTSPLLAAALPRLAGVTGCDELVRSGVAEGDLLLRPGPARMLRAVAAEGRDGFYGGEFGERLLEVGAGEYLPEDLARSQAEWVDGLALDVWGHRVWTVPPNSQGYLGLAGAGIAERLGLPADPDDGAWAHATVEAARLAGFDRPQRLFDGADGAALIAAGRLDERAAMFDPERPARLGDRYRAGGTIYLCATDADGMGVSLIQSNAKGFGCHVAVPGTGVLLHNRGLGFSLEDGHPAEYRPGRRPPHTLAPALVTRPDGSLRAVLGTMGGDSQTQVLLQMLARLLVAGQDPGTLLSAPRWVLAVDEGTGFNVWERPDTHRVRIEEHAPASWRAGLEQRGHEVETAGRDLVGFGHAHLIELPLDGPARGAADPRALVGACSAG